MGFTSTFPLQLWQGTYYDSSLGVDRRDEECLVMKMSIWYIFIGFHQLKGERFELKGKVFNDPLTQYLSRVRNEKI